MYPLKQSTSLTVPFFCHDANGDAVTGLTDGSFTKRISKGSGAFAAMTVTISEMENGWYSMTLSTTHTNTLGLLTVVFTNAGCKQVNLQWRVEANLVDDVGTDTDTLLTRIVGTLAAGTHNPQSGDVFAQLPTNFSVFNIEVGTGRVLLASASITASTFAANALNAAALATDAVNEIRDAILADSTPFNGATIAAIEADTQDIQSRLPGPLSKGTADSGSTTTMVDAARTETNTDHWKGTWLRMTSGGNAGITRLVTAFDPATDTITVSPAFPVTVAAGHTYDLLPAAWVEGINDISTAAANIVANRVWDELTAEARTGGSYGQLLKDDIDAAISSRSSHSAADVWSVGARTLTAFAFPVDLNADQSGVTVGTVNTLAAGALNAINAEVDTALVDIGLDHLLSAAVIGADVTDNSIFAKLVSKSATASWLTFNNTVDSLEAHHDYVVGAGFSTHSAADVWAVVTRTITGTAAGAIAAASFAAGAIDAVALATDAGQEIADRVLSRSLATGADGGRTVQDALRILRNKWGISGGTLTVTQENDVTTAWTAAVTQTAGNPVSEVDPA